MGRGARTRGLVEAPSHPWLPPHVMVCLQSPSWRQQLQAGAAILRKFCSQHWLSKFGCCQLATGQHLAPCSLICYEMNPWANCPIQFPDWIQVSTFLGGPRRRIMVIIIIIIITCFSCQKQGASAGKLQ